MRGLTWLCSIVLLALYGCKNGDCASEGSRAVLTGKVFLPEKSAAAAASTRVLVTADTGDEHAAFLRPDGTFSVQDLPSGSYLMDIACMGYMFPQYRVIVARRQARVQLLTGTKAILEDVVLMPLGKAVYYQQRKPFDVKATLMSPYGIMGMLAVFALVVFPLMKVDPEEYKQMQSDMAGTPLAGILGARTDTGGQPKALAAGGAPSTRKKRT